MWLRQKRNLLQTNHRQKPSPSSRYNTSASGQAQEQGKNRISGLPQHTADFNAYRREEQSEYTVAEVG
jgi:hypothetical protein